MEENGGAEMEDAIDYLANKFEAVNSIDTEYCNRCSQTEYARFDQLSDGFDCDLIAEDEVSSYMNEAAKRVRNVYIRSSDTGQFFERLLTRGIEIPKLANFLWFCVDSGLQPTKTKEEVKLALPAANLYVVLAAVKSAKLYKFYDVNIYQKCLELLRSTERLLRPLKSKVATVLNPKKRNIDPERIDPLGIASEADVLKMNLCFAMRSLFVSFNSNIVDAVLENDDRCRCVADFLRDVTYLDIDSASTSSTRRSIHEVESLSKVSDLTFAMFHSILDRRSELRTCTISSRVIMPYLLYWVCGNGKQAITGSLPNVLRDTCDRTVGFIGERIVHLNKFELECYMRVLKSLPLKCFDRSEYRSNVSNTFVEILCRFPTMAYYIIDDVYILGRHNKTVHRSFAYEIVNKLLQSFPFNEIPNPPVPLNELVADESIVGIDMDDIDNAQELMDATPSEAGEAEPMENETTQENGEAQENGETANETAATTEGDEAPDAEVSEQQDQTTTRRRAEPEAPVEPRDPNMQVVQFAHNGMTPKQAMLMLIINGLVDRQAKQKALQAIEDLFTKNACVKDLCFLATKFVDENFELLNLPGRLPTEPVQQEESQSREVDSRPISQIDNADDAQRLDSRNQSEPPQTNDEEAMETDENQQHGRQDILMSQEPSRFVFDLELREADDLIRLIIRAFEDDKTVVVKHALSACIAVLLQRSATIKDTQLFEKTVEEVTNKTWDTAVQVRKQAAVCLKDLLSDEKYVEQPIVEKAWLEGLLHQVVDNEATVSQQAVKFVIEYVFKGLNDVNSDRAWALMKRVEESSEYTRYLAICLTEHTSSASNATAVKSSGNLQDMINKLLKKLEQMALKDNCPAAAWMLLCELSYGAKKIKPECAEDTWPKLNLNSSDDRIPTYVAKVLANCCSQLNDERRNTLKEKIKWQLSHTRIATTHISAVCYALARLSDGVLPNGGNGNRSGLKEMAAFAKKYNDKLLQLLDKVVLRPTYSRIASRNAFTPALASQQTQQTQQSTPTVDPMKIIRAIYTVGELAQYAPTIDNNVFNFLRAGVVTDLIEDDVARAQTRLQSQQNRMSENGSQHTAMDDDNPVLPPGAIILPDSQSSSSQNTVAPASQHPTSINGEYLLSRGVRSAIFLTLGKFSIADENIAEAITARLAKQMREDRDHCIRNNLLVVMADIFRINTTAVSDHGPAMASCLRDPSVLIRKQALFLITSLLRDEYFKWDGQTMYFYLGALLDLEVEVREQVRASLMNVLLPKNPKMLINRFVEIMFYFNDVTHPNMTVSMQHEKENCPLPLDDRFALYGERRARDRMEIYKFMISTFSDVENLPLMCRIALEVFENITEERLRLYDEDEHTNERVYNRNVVCLLKDALNIVKSKDIVLTLQAGKKAGAAEELEEETEEANHMQAVAGDMIAHTFLKTINQEVLNRMFRLKDYLKKIPDLIELAKYTHSNILDIFEHYFEHFEKLIGNDSQRRGEVKSDLERIRKRAFPRQQPSA